MLPKLEWDFLRKKPVQILTVILVLQAALLYGFSRPEPVVESRPLATAEQQFGSWSMIQETAIEKDVLELLRADDTLNRSYMNPAYAAPANLFVAFFRSQRAGQTPHSPKNCLPGSGWVPSESNVVQIQVPGRAEPIDVNRYVVARADAKSLVLYWYQSRDRVVASEYAAKFFTISDAIRYNRTDTALVRVVVPIAGSNGVAEAEAAAANFIQSFFTPLRRHFPAS